ncbi:valine--tRNA ligase [Candidatus Woesearchaeota archaeon]|nr:valine--tRNA ligase [Candidatus Woesearchaeota archaeon]
MEFPKRYEPESVEQKWMKVWDDSKLYRFDPDSTDKVYSIDTPPPTVSGKMHMGHAFANSQQDFIARYKRMRGFNVLQPFGTDDNGLPTQLYIEKLKKVRAGKIGRSEFVKLCLETLEKELTPKFLLDWKRLGISCDFDVSYCTINSHCRRISQKSFLDLHKMGRAYRKEAPAMWCPSCMTAVSQVELEDKEIASHFNDIIFKAGDDDVVIATTRPELLPACIAVFYHPKDERYKHLSGKELSVPLFGFSVPVMADERVDPEKGTGIVMCCTFGDQTDMEWQKQYDLPIKTALDKSGRMTEICGKYKGMKIKEARDAMISDMKEQGLLIKQKPIVHAVNTHERCGTEIEFVHSKQWFIRYLDLREEMLEWGTELEWFPKHMKNRYDNWVKGLSWDWCISRQIYFGIPFPVWYCKSCGHEILAKENDLPVDPLVDSPPVKSCPKCNGTEFAGESDIINTWATSSLTPTIVKELFKGRPAYRHLAKNPMDVRPQGHDIITFWLFNTVVKSKLHFKMLPWRHCFINGWILDPHGKKMSKSKGNIIEPQTVIQKYSADILRYMCATSKLGEDLAFPEKELIAGKRFINKLWNAAKFCMMNLEGYDAKKHARPAEMRLIDRWMLSRLNSVIKESTESFDEYEFSRCKAAAEKFFWSEFCDFYLEIVKDRLYNKDSYKKADHLSAQYTLYETLLSLIKLFAPFTPFITEEIYQMYFAANEKEKKSVHVSSWPGCDAELINKEADLAGALASFVIAEARKAKTAENASLKTPVKLIAVKAKLPKAVFMKIEEDMKAATAAERIEYTQLDDSSKIEYECEVEV